MENRPGSFQYVPVQLQGGAPWGFTLKGGLEHCEPLTVSKRGAGGTGKAAWQLSLRCLLLDRPPGHPAWADYWARVRCGNRDEASVAFVSLTSHGRTRAHPFSRRGVAAWARPFLPTRVLPQRRRDFLHVEERGGNFCAMERSCVGAAAAAARVCLF
ncbi:hypothetical protein M91_11327 [Bos mutus]|uniref:Uncharacterized protein n=1 Tax=Bos mutus TaxID=72004 RepID=L8IDZ4_9CETA|nr:hypothetical protein M91_11327 [Bos mutus]